MRGILADANIQGHLRVLMRRLESEDWSDIWDSLNLAVCTFEDLGLASGASDDLLWQACQQREIVLITANRNEEGPNSLQATIRTQNTPASLPVFTLADPERFLESAEYAERVVEQLLEYLTDIDNCRGTGRLYLP